MLHLDGNWAVDALVWQNRSPAADGGHPFCTKGHLLTNYSGGLVRFGAGAAAAATVAGAGAVVRAGGNAGNPSLLEGPFLVSLAHGTRYLFPVPPACCCGPGTSRGRPACRKVR